MANGWAGDDAVHQQIDSTVADGVEQARRRLPAGEGRRDCEVCEAPIPPARRRAMPGARCCVACQGERDAGPGAHAPYNRRGSKDSQLR